jgi:hypothetical protein
MDDVAYVNHAFDYTVALAVKTDGTLVAWHTDRQAGGWADKGIDRPYSNPVTVAEDVIAAYVIDGENTCVCVKKDGGLYIWTENLDGGSVLTPVSGGEDAISFGFSFYGNMEKNDGSVWEARLNWAELESEPPRLTVDRKIWDAGEVAEYTSLNDGIFVKPDGSLWVNRDGAPVRFLENIAIPGVGAAEPIKPPVKSSDAALANLSLSAGTLSPVFSALTTEYKASVGNSVSSISVTAATADPKATASGDGVGAAKSLSVGANTLLITVTAEDGVTTETYSIIVTRAAPTGGSTGGGGGGGGGASAPVTPAEPVQPADSAAGATQQPAASGSAGAYSDVPQGAWFGAAVEFVAARGIMGGSGEAGTFQPQQTMTRAMLITALARYDGVNTAAGDTWYSAAVDWGIANGVTDGGNLNDSVSREQIVTMLWRYAGQPQGGASLDGVPDAAGISPWAVDAFKWAVETGIISGYEDKSVKPQNSAIRAEVAAMIMRFIQAVG